ncbi:MAG: 30S ribosomal protein S4 [bacterium]
MGRHIKSVCKLCRREGNKLFLKGDRCYTEKCSFKRRAYPPGQHGQLPQKISEYGMRLREKQKARRTYGLSERQFRTYFERALKWKGVTGEKLLELLERRLDNVIYRLGFAPSRAQARQLVTHGHIIVNDKKVNIPSLSVGVGDTIKIKEGISSKIRANLEKSEERKPPKWLSLDAASLEGKIESIPERKEIGEPITESMIVEFYSR